jgi:hypothetical protein
MVGSLSYNPWLKNQHMRLPGTKVEIDKPTFLLVTMIVLWIGIAGILAERKLDLLASSWGYDLAFFHNLMFNTAHGSWFTQTSSPHEAPGLFQLHHTYPILVVLLPVYALCQQVSTLLWVQVAAVASSALPVRRLALAGGATEKEAGLLGACFLLQLPVLMTALCDFRPIVLGIPLLLWTMVMVAEGRRWGTLAVGAACLAVREDMTYMLALLGLGAIALPVAGARRTLPGGTLLALAAGYWLVMKTAGGELTYYFHPRDFQRPNVPPADIPWLQKARFLGPYLLPLGAASVLALPLLAPGMLLLAYLMLWSPYEWADWTGVYGHHAAPLVASVSGAAALGWCRGLRNLAPWQRQRVLVGLLVAQAVAASALGPHLLSRTASRPPGVEQAEVEAVHRWLGGVARETSIATDYRVMGLVSGRATQYATADFGMMEDERFPWSGEDFPPGFEDVDVLIFDAGEDPALAAAARDCGAFTLQDHAVDYRYYRRTGDGGEACSAALRLR